MNETAEILFDRENVRNWQYDYTHENGNYVNTCDNCLRKFVGHKRRFTCRECYLITDCFNQNETDEQYFLRRKKELDESRNKQ